MAQNAPYLVADSREKFVHPFLRDAGVACVQRQIQVGDYLICRAAGVGVEPDILAVFERKTWKDFAASILDGRVANLDKMLELRSRTGCKIFYLLEGPAFPAPRARFHRVPFARIQAVVTELVVFHEVFVIQTLDQRHTAARLHEFAETWGRIPRGVPTSPTPQQNTPNGATTSASSEAKPELLGGSKGRLVLPAARGPGMPESRACIVPALATKIYEKSAADAAIEAWSRLRGVSLVLGKLLSERYSLASFVRGGVTASELDQIKTANGKALGRYARASLDRLRSGAKAEALRVLAGVPGVGPATAGALLDACEGSFARLLSYDVGSLGIITCGAGPKGLGPTKKFGDAKATRLHAALHFSGEPVRPADVPGQKTEPGPTQTVAQSAPKAPRLLDRASPRIPTASTPKTSAEDEAETGASSSLRARAPEKTVDPPENFRPIDAELFFELLGLEPPTV